MFIPFLFKKTVIAIQRIVSESGNKLSSFIHKKDIITCVFLKNLIKKLYLDW